MPLPLIPLIASLAPTLVKMASGSGKLAEVVEEAAPIVQKVTGVDLSASDALERVQEALTANPAAEAELRSKLAAIEQQELDSLLADKRDARARDVEIRRLNDGGNDRATVMLGLAFLSITAICALLILYPVPGEVLGFLTGIGGMFARNIGTAFDFEFGSSRGSKQKSAQLDKLAAALPLPLGR